MSTPLLPTNALVARAWLALIPGITAAMVGSTLPRIPANTLPAWPGTGFLTVQTIGGTPSPDSIQAEPVVSVKCWAATASQASAGAPVIVSDKPPWGRSEQLAELVRTNAYALQRGTAQGLVSMPVSGYGQACVLSAYLVSEIIPIPGDIAGYACHQFNLALAWNPVMP